MVGWTSVPTLSITAILPALNTGSSGARAGASAYCRPPAKGVVGTSAVVSTGLSVGYAIWLIRGGSLLAAFFSSVPAWQTFDPLPILDSFREKAKEDSESLLSIATGPSAPPAADARNYSPKKSPLRNNTPNSGDTQR